MTARITKALRSTAYHEAGHAVMGYALGRRLRQVTIEPGDDTLGHVLYVRLPKSFLPDGKITTRIREHAEHDIMCSLAGGIAEAKIQGRASHRGAGEDYRHAVDMASYLCGSSEEVSAYVKWLWVRTKQKLEIPWLWHAVELLAVALLERRTLSGDDAVQIIRSSLGQPAGPTAD